MQKENPRPFSLMKLLALSLFLLALSPFTFASKSGGDPLFDLTAIRDASTLETKVLRDWGPAAKDASIQQKLIEISLCEWWPGQRVRVPVTLNAPTGAGPCRNVLVINMNLNPKMATPSGAALELLKNHGVGVVMIGMGTIDAMQPLGELHLGMREQLLKTQDVRYTAGWIWGMTQMRGLTAAMAEPEHFQPRKVLATGGSKRGIGSAMAGIHDDRFTAILPIVAPPLGNPGGTFVLGTEPKANVASDKRFFEDLLAGKLGLDTSVKTSLDDRSARRSASRITLPQAQQAGWTRSEIRGIADRVWAASRIVDYLPELKKRGFDYFYNVGSNDSVTPALLELGKRFPDFPVNIVPGGQHGGPSTAGFDRRVTTELAADNVLAFARYHFFGDRELFAAPKVVNKWNAKSRALEVTATFPDGTEPESNELWWAIDKSEPFTLSFEYDAWDSVPMRKTGQGRYFARIELAESPKRLDFLTVHTHTENKLPLTRSSPYQRVR